MQILPTVAYADNPSISYAAKFVHASTNKNRCSINKVLVSCKNFSFFRARPEIQNEDLVLILKLLPCLFFFLILYFLLITIAKISVLFFIFVLKMFHNVPS